MGVSASLNTTVNVMSTSITQSLIQRVNASANATCTVSIGSISFTENNGCAVTVSNMCSSSSTGVLNAVLDGIFQAYDQLDISNKQAAAQIFSATYAVNTNVTDIKRDFSTYVDQQCGASSNLNQSITVQNFDMGKCTAPGNTPINFNFVNSGRADANCAIGILQKLLVESSNKIAIENTQSSSLGVLVFGAVAIAGIFALLVYLWYVKKIFTTNVQDKIRLEWSKREVIPWPLELEMFNAL